MGGMQLSNKFCHFYAVRHLFMRHCGSRFCVSHPCRSHVEPFSLWSQYTKKKKNKKKRKKKERMPQESPARVVALRSRPSEIM